MSMLLKKEQIPVFIIHSIALVIYFIVFLSRANYEFLGYIGVITFFMVIVLLTNNRVNYPNGLLLGLAVWSILHMSGGGILIEGKRLYDFMILPIVGAPYYIFKFDQFVHIIGFWVATLLMYCLIKPIIKKDNRKFVALSIVVIMASVGAGAMNEIIEFSATLFVKNTGVGSYENLIGAVGAMVYIIIKEKKKLSC